MWTIGTGFAGKEIEELKAENDRLAQHIVDLQKDKGQLTDKVKELKGVERHIDNLGRLVIPKEMRDKLNFDTNELVDIKLVNDHIQVSKSRTRCLFCNCENDIKFYKNYAMCKTCLDDMIGKFSEELK